MKKLICTFLVIILSITVTGAESMDLSKKNEGFRFEDYKTADEAKTALLKLHPVGSPIEDLLKTLELSGATIKELQEKEIYPEWRIEGFAGAKSFNYAQGKTFLTSYSWGGAIHYDTQGKIIRFGVSKHYMGL